MVRLAAYGSLSCAAAAYVVFSAFRLRSNFFAAAVYLSKSNASMMILWNFGVFLSILFGRALQTVFFGPLRLIEIERLHERAWYAVTESLLALTIFREAFDTSFVILFVSLLFLKVFHWLAGDRVEMMEQAPSIPRLFHIRMTIVLSTLWFFDLLLIALAADSILTDGPSVMIMFASEYMIMLATLLGTTLKYGANVYDLRNEVPWENKSVFIFYVELACDFLKLATYLCFFSLILTFYGLPLNILRDVYITARSFVLKVRDLTRYRRATRNMDQRYPHATPEEMERLSDKTCIICREEMEARSPGQEQTREARQGPNDTPKKLPCGHIFHFHCLRSWLERQQSCPTCRRPVLSSDTSSTRRAAVQAPPAAPAQPGAAVNPGNLNRADARQRVPTPPPTTAPGNAPISARAPGTATPNTARRRAGPENPLVAFQLRSASKPPVQSDIERDSKATSSSATTASKQPPADVEKTQANQATSPAAQVPRESSAAAPVTAEPSEPREAQRQRQLEAAMRRRGISATTAVPSIGPADPAKASEGTSSSASGTAPSPHVSGGPGYIVAPAPQHSGPTPTPTVATTSSANAAGESVQVALRATASEAGLPQPVPGPSVLDRSAVPLEWKLLAGQSVSSGAPQYSTANAQASGPMPRLIPLFDPNHPGQPGIIARLLPASVQQAFGTVEARQPASQERDMAHLPEDVTDDQLASLAEVTREGLKTRLNLLNSTQDTLQACIRQIQSAMKVLDAGELQGVMQVVSELNAAQGREKSSTNSAEEASGEHKGKGRASEATPDQSVQPEVPEVNV